jgi:hypothetical protein
VNHSDPTNDTKPRAQQSIGLSPLRIATIVIFSGIACFAIAVVVFPAPERLVQDNQTLPNRQSPPSGTVQTQRTSSHWAVRQVAGLRVLVPNEVVKADRTKLSPQNSRNDLLEARPFERSESWDAVGDGFYIIVIHIVARPDAPGERDLEQAAWKSVNQLNPALIAPNAEKTVRKSLIAGRNGFRASCPIINRGRPSRFEAATFERGDEWWLVSVVVTDPNADDTAQIEQIMDSIEITTP